MTQSPLWTPSADAIKNTELAKFAALIKEKEGIDWQGDYERLWSWSVTESPSFWSQLWDWHKVIGTKGEVELAEPDKMLGGQFFPEGKLNYAENMLINPDSSTAILAYDESGKRKTISRQELYNKVMALAGWLIAEGVKPGERVAAYTPNIAEAVITMLASASIGAIFSSCSSDFGVNGAKDRFGQIEPAILMAADGYSYGGKPQPRMEVVKELASQIPSIRKVLIVPFLEKNLNLSDDLSDFPQAMLFDDALKSAEPLTQFEPMPFNHPLYILYSSGTTGVPKCITHSAGGVLLQHIKEHRLHCDIKKGEVVFYFTTCGWMMWNWLVSALALEASIVLYEGNPFYPQAETLWQMIDNEGVSLFGTSAKYIDALRKSDYRPIDEVDLKSLRVICSTGSPLTEEGFRFVYQGIKQDLQLASIAGGTDLVSCFVLGCPVRSVYAGEIQARGLGMAVEIFSEEGKAITGEQGELVCTKPFPSMPIGFWGDENGERYRDAYFNHFEGIWRHGDWATLTSRGGIIMHGRSDATLNPGGVRIGTAEIYRQVEAFDEIQEALVIGQTIVVDGAQDIRVILFVRLTEGAVLDDALKTRIAKDIREGATPRHVPSVIVAVKDLPRTRSGKITELAVRDIVEGRPIKNTEALANPEALDYFRDLPELSLD